MNPRNLLREVCSDGEYEFDVSFGGREETLGSRFIPLGINVEL